MNEIITFLENTKVYPQIIEDNISHPINNKKYPKRFVYNTLKGYAKDFFKAGYLPRMLVLVGLRGVGKTILLWQLADYIYKNKTKEVYFFYVDELENIGISLSRALELFQEHILKKRFEENSKPLLLLFDEIQTDKKWATTLKLLYEKAKNVFIVCTGSSALNLQSTADLARRAHFEKIYPFNFIEFIFAKSIMENEKSKEIVLSKKISEKLKNGLFYSENIIEIKDCIDDIAEEIEEYWHKIVLNYNHKNFSNGIEKKLIWKYIIYHNIPTFLFYKNNQAIIDEILGILKRIINEDIPIIINENLSISDFRKLLSRLAASEEINLTELSSKLEKKENEIDKMIDVLEKAELINTFLPCGNIDRRIFKKRKKMFFISPSIRYSLLMRIYGKKSFNIFKGRLLEDIISFYLKRVLRDVSICFFDRKNAKSPDFLIETMDKPLLLEVGISKNSAEQIINSPIKYRYGIIVSLNRKSPEIKGNILFLPLSWFLLL